MEFDWSLLISFVSLGLSLWNTFERWNDKQLRIFLSDLGLHAFNKEGGQLSDIRIDLTITALSELPIPISGAAISLDKERWFDCSTIPPSPNRRSVTYSEAENSRYRKVENFFGPSIRFPATLSPSSAQHICLWFSLPFEDELLSSLMVLSCSDRDDTELGILLPEESSNPCTDKSSHAYRCAKEGYLYVEFRSGNQILSSSVRIDSRCYPHIPD